METISLSTAVDVSRGIPEEAAVSMVFVGARDADVASVSMDGEAGELSGSAGVVVIVVVE